MCPAPQAGRPAAHNAPRAALVRAVGAGPEGCQPGAPGSKPGCGPRGCGPGQLGLVPPRPPDLELPSLPQGGEEGRPRHVEALSPGQGGRLGPQAPLCPLRPRLSGHRTGVNQRCVHTLFIPWGRDAAALADLALPAFLTWCLKEELRDGHGGGAGRSPKYKPPGRKLLAFP